MENLKSVKYENGFMNGKSQINKKVTLISIYNQFKNTGRFDALDCKPRENKSHIFWDSDAAKWLESVSLALVEFKDEQLYQLASELIDKICKHQREDGYYNSYFMAYEPENIFTDREKHELYCAGHLFEAAYVWKLYQNDDRLLNFSSRYTDYIINRFTILKDTLFVTPGHEEIELALLKLYSLTNDEKYFNLAKFFLKNRGVNENENAWGYGATYCQSHKSIYDQDEAVGHCVRAEYLYIAMAEYAKIANDEKLKEACMKLADDIINNKMYVTGGVGSTYIGERFTFAYHLPNGAAYTETCASIGLALFMDKLIHLSNKAIYGDTFERVLYNGVLSGVSHDGKAFFYENPLEINMDEIKFSKLERDFPRMPITKRLEVFGCSCCPPNVSRFIEEVPMFIYYDNESELTIQQYISSSIKKDKFAIKMSSGFPYKGNVTISIDGEFNKALKLRKPYWCDEIKINQQYELKDNFVLLNNPSSLIEIEFVMKLKKVFANPLINEDVNKVALLYGPLVMCAEGVDNDYSLKSIKPIIDNYELIEGEYFKIKTNCIINESTSLYSFTSPKEIQKELVLIPYFEWANREESDMRVWFLK